MTHVVFINRGIKGRYFNFETCKWTSKLVHGCLIQDKVDHIRSAHEIICSTRADYKIYHTGFGVDSTEENDFVAPVIYQDGKQVADFSCIRDIPA